MANNLKIHPKVTVILTSYNHAGFIGRTIDSVLNQTYSDFQLIIIDDHSSDNSWDIITSYRDNRIHAIRNKTNLGTCYIKDAVGNIPLGEFIAIHHSDDIWEASKLEKQISVFKEHPEYAAVFSNAKIINESGKDFEDTHHFCYAIFDQPNRSRHQWLRLFFLKGNVLCNPSAIIRKAPFLNLVTLKGLYQLSDLSMWVQLCLNNEIHIFQEKLVRFRVRDDNANMSGNRPGARTRHRYELQKIMDIYCQISSQEDLLAIFPEAEKYITPNNIDILYALGRTVVEISQEKPIQLFGLNLLFEALNDEIRSKALQQYQGFHLKDFIKLSSENDIYSYETIQKLSQDLEKCKNKEQFYSQSRSWRYTKPLRQFMSLIRKYIKRK